VSREGDLAGHMQREAGLGIGPDVVAPRGSVVLAVGEASARPLTKLEKQRRNSMMMRSKVALVASIVVARAWLANDARAAEANPENGDEAAGTNGERQDEPRETWWSPRKKEPARFGVAVNPIGLLFGMLLAEFDYGLSDRVSLNLIAVYWSLDVLGFETTAWGAGVGAQFFPIEVANSGPLYQGFYVYPSLQLANVNVKYEFIEDASWVTIAPQASVGWQWDWRPLTVRTGIGAALYIGSVPNGYESDLDGFRWFLDGTIGLTFGG
jgi:hypothetical protein